MQIVSLDALFDWNKLIVLSWLLRNAVFTVFIRTDRPEQIV